MVRINKVYIHLELTMEANSTIRNFQRIGSFPYLCTTQNGKLTETGFWNISWTSKTFSAAIFCMSTDFRLSAAKLDAGSTSSLSLEVPSPSPSPLSDSSPEGCWWPPLLCPLVWSDIDLAAAALRIQKYEQVIQPQLSIRYSRLLMIIKLTSLKFQGERLWKSTTYT